MENRAHALVAGLFTLFLGAGVLFAIWWLSGKREDTRELLLVTQRSVAGLNPQAQVRFRGVRCGKVQEINLDPLDAKTIVVRVSVRRDIPITQATTAEIRPQGITGLAYIELQDSGSGAPPLAEGAVGDLPRIALKPSPVELVSDDLTSTLANVRVLTSRIAQVVSDENLKKLSTTLGNVESASGNVAEGAAQLPQIAVSLRQTLSPENVERINRMIADLERTGRNTGPLVADLRALVNSSRGAVDMIESFTSATATEVQQDFLPRVANMLSDMVAGTKAFSRAAEKLENEPQAVIFGPSPAKPGPGEPGFVGPPAR